MTRPAAGSRAAQRGRSGLPAWARAGALAAALVLGAPLAAGAREPVAPEQRQGEGRTRPPRRREMRGIITGIVLLVVVAAVVVARLAGQRRQQPDDDDDGDDEGDDGDRGPGAPSPARG